MNMGNINKFTLKIMLVIIVAQVFAPTIYKAAEVNKQTSVEFATFEDFIFDEDKNEYALKFDADQEIDIDFTYDEDASVEDYDFKLNEKTLDIDQVATTVVGTNEVTIAPNVEDARDISSLKLNVAKENLELLRIKEVEDNNQTSDVTSESETVLTTPAKVKAADTRVDDFTITKQFVGAKLGGTFAANDDVLTWRLILENNGTVKTNVRALITPDADDVVGAIIDVVVVKNGETLTVGTDYTVKSNDIKLLDPVDAHDTVTIDYSENTVSEFATTTAILDKSFIYADGFANPKQVLKYVGKIPSNAHEIVVHKTVMDRSQNDKAAFGEKLMYILNVQNTGQVNETNVTILDAVDDPNLDLSTIKLNAIQVENGATITSNTFDSTEGVKVVADMPKGSNVTIRFYVDVKTSGIKQIKSDLERGLNKQIDNSFSVTADLLGDTLTDSVSIPIDYDEAGMNDLTVNKTLEATTDGDLLADANEYLYFKITVENQGALVQENVILTDEKSGEFNGEITNLEIKNGTTTLVEGTDYTFDAATKKITIPSIDSNTSLTITYTLKTATVFENHDDLSNSVSTISDEVTEPIKSEVKVPKDLAKNAVIRAEDAEYNVAEAPRTNADVLKALGVEARDVDGTDITKDIVIENLTGYNLENPVDGEYPITISVIGNNSVKVTTVATLRIIQDGNPINNIQMLAISPIVVLKGSGENAATVIDSYANAMVVEQIANNPKTQYSVGSDTIVSNGGYDNNKNGTYVFKLETTGNQTELKVSTLVTVIVTDNPTNADASATIDGQDIKLLKGSAYTNDLAVVFHKKSYDKVTAEVTQSGAVTPIALSGANVAVSNVDTSTAGVYNTVFSYNDKATFAKPVETVKTLKVTVVEKAATNAIISASDLEIDQPFAPTTNAQLITDLRANAKEANGTDLTSAIKVTDLGGYNLAAPATGEFVIQFSVTGADGVIVTTSANLKVVTDGAPYNAIDMTVTTPIVIANGSGDNTADVINKYGFPMVTEIMEGIPSLPYSVGDETIVSNGGYDNNTNGTYIFKLQATGIESTLTVSRLVTVIVTDNPNSQDANAFIDGKDIKVLKGSYYDDKVAVILHANNYDKVTAKVTEKGTVTPVTLSDSNVLVKNVNTNEAGVYTTTFAYKDEARFTTPVEAVKTLKVTVVEKAATNAVISASDLEVEKAFAPTTNAQLITDLRADAKEVNGTDLTNAIKVVDLGGYNLAAPATGDFVIQFSVTGADGVIVTTSANLKVVTDGAPYNAIDMTVTTPIVITNGSGDDAAAVINKYGFPMITETMAGEPSVPYSVGDETIVSNGGYDNNTNGTYIFKLQTTGIESTLTVSRLVTVIVTDNPNTLDANAVIDGKDIQILKGSFYDDKVAVILHAKSYDNVTAKVTEEGTVTPVTLSDSHVIASNVKEDTVGVYSTTFAYKDETRFTTPVEAVKTLKVTVVEKAATNAVISASDFEIELELAPTSNAQLITDLRANAKEVNGTDLTSAIKVIGLGGYNLAAPATGDYVIHFSVTGADGVSVTTSANLKVFVDGAGYNTIDMTVTTPIVIANGSGENAATVINKYGNPMVTEIMKGIPSVPYSVGDETIVSNGGYDNNTNGTYIFKLQTTGIESTLTVSRLVTVIVTDNPNTLDANAVIDGKDIQILKGSFYNDKVAVIFHAKSYDNVTAKVTEKGTVTPVTLSDSHVIASNVKEDTVGVYSTTFAYKDETRFTTPVEAVKTLKVTVVEKAATNAVISAVDTEVKLKNAPKTVEDVLTTINANAKEANGTDLTSAINIIDFGGYNVASPAMGNFTLVLSVVGSDGVVVTTNVVLKVISNGKIPNEIEMVVTSPITIENGSGENDATVINKYGNPMVMETMAGIPSVPYLVGDETIVSNGGYDNDTNGTYIFKLQTTGIESTLTVSRLVTVIVTDNPETVDSYVAIDGQDITVLQGSFYSNRVATVLHNNNYEFVTAEISQSGEITPVSLYAANIIESNVKTNIAGEYTTTYMYADATKYAAPVKAVRTFKVTVVPSNEATNAVLSASDAEVDIENAPTSNEELLALINAKASEANGDDLTEAIIINTMGGYSFTTPVGGEYTIGLSVVGKDGVKVVEIVTLKVMDAGAAVNSIEMLVTTPIVIANGSGENAAAVIDNYANAMVQENVGGAPQRPYAIDSKALVNSGGYDNNTNGTYIFKLETIGNETDLKVSRLVTVIVTDDPTTVKAYATIDGKDIKILKGSAYDGNLALILHRNTYDQVTAEVSENVTKTPVSMAVTDIVDSNVNEDKVGQYTTTFKYADDTNYATPVSAVKSLKVTVVDKNEGTNAIISGTDTQVELTTAPKTTADLLNVINADAVLVDGTNVANQIFVIDSDGYDLTSPAEGVFKITIGVFGSDGVLVTTEVNLEVLAEKEEINEIDMLITTPVIVELGNGMDPKAVIEQMIYPTVVETEKGKVNLGYAETGSTLVSAGGYDNDVAGTYYFKLQATGVKTGLEVERLAKVIVTDNSKQDDVNAMIDGRDIELLVNSKYDVDNVALLHANNYDQVTAEINAAGAMDSVTLAGENVVASTVNVKKPGTYQTIFYYKDEKTRSVTEEVSAIKPLLVKVVDASEGADKIEITKTVQSQDGKSIVSDNGTLNYTINVNNTSPDLVFNELTLADDLANTELSIANVSDVKVTDKSGADVTADYEISLDNKIAVMINTLRPNDELNITFNIKLDDDVTVKTIDNTATMSFDGKSKKSNTAKINTDYSDKVTPNEETSSENKSNEETSDETTKDNETKSENQQMKIANTGSNELFILLLAFSAIIIIRFKRS